MCCDVRLQGACGGAGGGADGGPADVQPGNALHWQLCELVHVVWGAGPGAAGAAVRLLGAALTFSA